jgi:HAD superfamily hydrolase (TIGR01509 family)
MIRLVIFDCDGVLVDSEPITNQVLSDNLAQYGLNISASETHALFAGGTMKGAGEDAQARGAQLPANWLDEIYDAQARALRKGVPVIPGVINLLDQLDHAGIATAVASNGSMAKMQITLSPSGLWDRLQGRLYSGHDFAPKPDPAMLQHACTVAGVTLSEAVMIDDTAAGCRAAQNAGIRCFGFRPEGETSDLIAVGAEPVRSMAAIGRVLGLTA